MSTKKFSPDVEELLGKLANLPQIRCAWVDFIFPQGYSEQCRVYKDGDTWMMEFLRDRRGTVEQFFENMDVYAPIQGGMRIVQGRSKYGTIRELGPNVRGWYRDSDWQWVLENLVTEEKDTAR